MSGRSDGQKSPGESPDSPDYLLGYGWQDSFQSPAEFREYVREFTASVASDSAIIDKARIKAEWILRRGRL